MPDTSPGTAPISEASGTVAAARQFVIFQLADESCCFPMEAVREIIRVPRLVPVPLAPPSLLGLANLRGTVLPVVDLRPLVGLPPREPDDGARILVVDHHGLPAGLLVDRVSHVETVDAARIEPADGIEASLPGSSLEGVIHGDDTLVLMLDPERLLDREYEDGLPRDEGAVGVTAAGAARTRQEEDGTGTASEETAQFVTFRVAGEEYALAIEDVEEIVRVPDAIRDIPGTPSHVLGLVDLRGRALPLVTLRGLFGLPAREVDEAARVLVVRARAGLSTMPPVGIVVDDVHEVLSVPRTTIEPTPALLARTGDLAEITGICRLEGGARLVSVIEARQLLGNRAVRTALEASAGEGDQQMNETDHAVQEVAAEEDPQFVVFQLAGEEYCAPIEQVQEIIRVPEKMNRVPGTPDFVEGLINLRGSVLPVLDLRSRFALERLDDHDRQRILVIDAGGVRTGMIVDSVIEVLRLPAKVLEPAPAAASSAIDAVRQVANLPEADRMLFVLDVGKVLDEREQTALEGAMTELATGQNAPTHQQEPAHA